MKKVGFLETQPGYKSSTRLFSLIILVFWFVVSFYQISKTGSFSAFEFHLLIVVAALAPKSVNKFFEIYSAIKKPESIELDKTPTK